MVCWFWLGGRTAEEVEPVGLGRPQRILRQQPVPLDLGEGRRQPVGLDVVMEARDLVLQQRPRHEVPCGQQQHGTVRVLLVLRPIERKTAPDSGESTSVTNASQQRRLLCKATKLKATLSHQAQSESS